MDGYVKECIKIAVEIFMTIIIINFIVLISSVSYTVFYAKVNNEALQKELILYRDLYMYDNKIVKGNDIVAAVQKFKGVYNVYVKKADGAVIAEFLIGDAFDNYLVSDVMGIIYNDLETDFTANLVWFDEFNVNLDEKGVIGLEFKKL